MLPSFVAPDPSEGLLSAAQKPIFWNEIHGLADTRRKIAGLAEPIDLLLERASVRGARRRGARRADPRLRRGPRGNRLDLEVTDQVIDSNKSDGEPALVA